MAITVVLICLGLQRYLHLNSYTHQYSWMVLYYGWLKEKVPVVVETQGWLAVAIVIVPVLIVVSLLFSLVYHIFGMLGYFILSVAFLWYCIDARDFGKESLGYSTAESILKLTYRNLFGVLFWFFFLGASGIALYVAVKELKELLSEQKEEGKLLQATMIIQGALDWIPVRLLGLSFALVGNFVVVFKEWMKSLSSGILQTQDLVVSWGNAAIGKEIKPASSQTEDALSTSKMIVSSVSIEDAIALVDRALLLWLVVMAVFTIGFWFGLL